MQRFNVSSYSWVSPYNEVLLWGHAIYFQAHHGSTLHMVNTVVNTYLFYVFFTMKINVTCYSPLYLKAGLFILLDGHHGPPKYDKTYIFMFKDPINIVKN